MQTFSHSVIYGFSATRRSAFRIVSVRSRAEVDVVGMMRRGWNRLFSKWWVAVPADHLLFLATQ